MRYTSAVFDLSNKEHLGRTIFQNICSEFIVVQNLCSIKKKQLKKKCKEFAQILQGLQFGVPDERIHIQYKIPNIYRLHIKLVGYFVKISGEGTFIIESYLDNQDSSEP